MWRQTRWAWLRRCHLARRWEMSSLISRGHRSSDVRRTKIKQKTQKGRWRTKAPHTLEKQWGNIVQQHTYACGWMRVFMHDAQTRLQSVCLSLKSSVNHESLLVLLGLGTPWNIEVRWSLAIRRKAFHSNLDRETHGRCRYETIMSEGLLGEGRLCQKLRKT